MAQRDFETADKLFDRAIAADPQSFAAHGMKSALAIAWKGDVGFAENQLVVGASGIRSGRARYVSAGMGSNAATEVC